MKTFTAFVAGTIFGPAVLITWSLWHVGPERRAEVKKSWKATWNKGVEKAKAETPPADDKIEDGWLAEITYHRHNQDQIAGWLRYYWMGCHKDNVYLLMERLDIRVGTTLVRRVRDGRIGMKQSTAWDEELQSKISDEL